MPSPLADRPPQVLRPFSGPADTIREMVKAAVGPRGEQSATVHSLKNSIVRELEPKDYLSEILAVRFFAAERIRYSNDALTVEQVQDPERICDQIIQYGKAVGDCDDIATWIATVCRQLGREAQFVTVGFGPAGHYTHVFTRVKEPKSQRWIVCDPVAGPTESSMLHRVTTYKIWEI
jgi:hypothetical protein